MNAFDYAIWLIKVDAFLRMTRLMLILNLDYQVGFCPRHQRWESWS